MKVIRFLFLGQYIARSSDEGLGEPYLLISSRHVEANVG